MISAPPPVASCRLPETAADLRIALFSGNYNMTTDGANRALNRLVEYLLRRGAGVRVYSPTVPQPAFAPTGDLVSIPSLAIPGRPEYRFPLTLSAQVRRDLEAFAPDVVHVSSPDPVAHRAVTWARKRGLPVLASAHTRFETYLAYYRLGALEPVMEAGLRRFYRRCDALVAPSESFAALLRKQRMNPDISLWTRGVDHTLFNPGRRSAEWRRELRLGDDELVVGFLGRLVLEKGLDVFAATIAALRDAGVPHRVVVIGEGPARDWFAARVPDAVFAGFLAGEDLARGVASMDVLCNPSVTETFGNVTLEAMASGVPVVAAAATGSTSLITDGVTGRLLPPGDADAFAAAIAQYARDPATARAHGAAGHARAADYTWDRINQAVADTYLRLVRAKANA